MPESLTDKAGVFQGSSMDAGARVRVKMETALYALHKLVTEGQSPAGIRAIIDDTQNDEFKRHARVIGNLEQLIGNSINAGAKVGAADPSWLKDPSGGRDFTDVDNYGIEKCDRATMVSIINQFEKGDAHPDFNKIVDVIAEVLEAARYPQSDEKLAKIIGDERSVWRHLQNIDNKGYGLRTDSIDNLLGYTQPDFEEVQWDREDALAEFVDDVDLTAPRMTEAEFIAALERKKPAAAPAPVLK